VLFERAMEAMQRHRYADAAAEFRRLLEQFPLERALLDRARLYRDLCEREVHRQPAAPRTVEERLTAATAALNIDDDRRAEALVRSVLDEQPDADLALYLMAAIQARRGAEEEALRLLGRAVEVSPEARAQARYDPDFERLRDLDRFRALTDAPAGTGAGRRLRRNRTER
jgi:tetratricopeptide (TPR) repeat protein